MVQRFSLYYADLDPDPDGELVRYEDYERLRKVLFNVVEEYADTRWMPGLITTERINEWIDAELAKLDQHPAS